MQTTIDTFSYTKVLTQVSRLCFCVALFALAVFSAVGQTPGSLQVGYINTFVGSPVGYASTTGVAEPICGQSISTSFRSAAAGYSPGGIGDGCPPSQALLGGTSVGIAGKSALFGPAYVVIDSAGNFYIGDQGNYAIRMIYNGGASQLNLLLSATNIPKILSATNIVKGYIYSLCGPQTGSYSNQGSTGGPCYNTNMQSVGLAIDTAGDIYDSDGQSRIRLINNGGQAAYNQIVTGEGSVGTASETAAPNTTPATTFKMNVGSQYVLSYSGTNGYYGDGGLAYDMFAGQVGIWIDANQNIYMADSHNGSIRKIDPVGIVTTIVGAGAGCTLASTVKPGAKNPFATVSPSSLSSPNIAGQCVNGFSGDGGPASASTMNAPNDVIFDKLGNMYIADSGNGRVRVVYAGGTLPGISNPVPGYIYTLMGGGTLGTGMGGPATQIVMKSATGLGMDAQGNLYVADGTGHVIWELDMTTGMAAVIAGNGTAPAITTTVPAVIPTYVPTACSAAFPASAGGPLKLHANGDGCPATQANIGNPTGRMSFDAEGNLYFADSTANNVRVISHQQIPAPTVAVGQTSGVILGFIPLSTQTFGPPVFTGNFHDAGGSTCNGALTAGQVCYVNVQFSPTLPGLRAGGVSLVSTTGTAEGGNFVVGEATGSEIALDSANVTQVGSGLTPTGVAIDGSGAVYVADQKTGSVYKYANFSATTPSATLLTGLSKPGQVFVDGEGNVLVADSGNNRIAMRSGASGAVTYITGVSNPQGVGVDGLGNIYISDTGNNRVLQIQPGGAPTVLNTSVVAPTQISIDASDNVYIVDSGNGRLVELPGGSGIQAAIATGTFIPVAAALDPAGDIYVLDKTTMQVGFISAGGAITNTLLSGLTTPANMAVDSLGNIAVADSASSSVTLLNRQQITVPFYPLNVGQTSVFSSFTVTDIGNAPLNFTNKPPYVGTGATAQYVATPSINAGCAGQALAPGAGCSVSATFAPVALGSATATLTFPSDAGNEGTAQAQLVGNAVNELNSNLTISSSPSNTSSVQYGTPITLSFKLTQSGSTAATGQIIVQVNGIRQAALTPVNGVATYTFSPQAGSFVIAGQYTGDSNYVSSYATLNLTVSPAQTTTVLTYSGLGLNVTGGATPSYTLSATVTSTVPVTGVVSFMSGSTTLGMSSVNSKGVATLILYDTNLTPASLPFGSTTPTAPAFLLNTPTFTATYLGLANFVTSTSNSVTVQGDFGLAITSPSIAAPAGAVSNTTLIVTPYLGQSGTVTFTCSNLPANALCRFLPNTLSFPQPTPTETTLLSGFSTYYAQGAAGNVQLQLYTTVPPNLAMASPSRAQPWNRRQPSRTEEAGFGIFSALLIVLWRGRRKPLARSLLLVLLLTVLPLAAGIGLTGCGQGNFYNYPTPATPTGVTTFFVTATSSTGATESLPVQLTVGPSQ